MMMKCLEVGGMSVARNIKRDKWLVQRFDGPDGYRANEDGFYELTVPQYKEAGFPGRWEGMVFKFLWANASLTLPIVAGKYRGVFMRRSYLETIESCEAMLESPDPFGSEAVFDQKADDMLGMLRARNDMDMVECQFGELCADPMPFFVGLANRGWPIDPHLAAANVHSDRRRFVEGVTV